MIYMEVNEMLKDKSTEDIQVLKQEVGEVKGDVQELFDSWV